MLTSLIIRHNEAVLTATGYLGHRFVSVIESSVGNKIKLYQLVRKVNWMYLEIDIFFLPELHQMLEHIIKRTHRYSKLGINTTGLIELRNYIEKEVWKKQDTKVGNGDPYDYSIIRRKFNVDILEHQDKAVRRYKEIKNSNSHLRGMLLFGDTGTGKSLCSLMLAELVLSEKVILVVPLQTIHRVWTSTIEERYKTKEKYYIVGEKDRYTNQKFIICSYENLPKLLGDTKLLSFARTTLIVDESHNFADHKSNRTGSLLNLVNKLNCDNNILMSGTPIKSGFKELAIILSMLDRSFKSEIVSRFINLYKSPSKFMLNMLQERFTSITARMEKHVLKLDPVITKYIPVKLKNGNKYRLSDIKETLREYIIDRSRHYEKLRPTYEENYKKLYLKAKEKLKHSVSAREFEEYEIEFKMVIRYYEQGILMKYPDLVARVNAFEDRVLLTALEGEEKTLFKEAKTVLKYVVLKIQGEALANVVMRARINAHKDMAAALSYKSLLESTNKKTIIFSNYTDVCDAALEKVRSLKYKPITVYGETTKNLNQNVAMFVNKKDINPLVTTFKSLSTGVPLVIANVIIVLDLPFRMYVYEQAIARAWRLGQDQQVYVYIPKLDTGEAPNINSRNIDIIQFFKEEVENITGQKMSISLDATVGPSTEDFKEFMAGVEEIPKPNLIISTEVMDTW